jgi:hypothetical protein
MSQNIYKNPRKKRVLRLIELIFEENPDIPELRKAINVPHDVMFFSNPIDYANTLYKYFLIFLLNVGKDIVNWPKLTALHIMKRERGIKRDFDNCLKEYNILKDLGGFDFLPEKIVNDIVNMIDDIEDICEKFYEYYRKYPMKNRNRTIRNKYRKIQSALTRKNRTPLPTIPEENDNS